MRGNAVARVGSCLVLASAEVALALLVCVMRLLALLARPLAEYVERVKEDA
jgi:hypothetical protein